MGITLSQSEEKKPGTRTGRPNYPREFRERLAAAACEPGVSVSKLARENGINAKMLFAWRRRYLSEQQAQSAGLIPVVLVSDTPAQVVAPSPIEPRAQDTRRGTLAGTIEIRIGRAVVKVDGMVDADLLRIVLGSLRLIKAIGTKRDYSFAWAKPPPQLWLIVSQSMPVSSA